MDIKGAFAEALGSGKDFDAATSAVLDEFEEDLRDSDEGPGGYLALAAVQLEHGEFHDWLRERALGIIDRRRGLALWREQGRDSLDLHQEARRKLRRRILSVNPREVRKPRRKAKAPRSVADESARQGLESASLLRSLARERPLTVEESATAVSLLTDRDMSTSFAAADALETSHKAAPMPKETFAPLLASLSSDEPQVRQRAADAILNLRFILRGLADETWLPPLLALLGDRSAKVRESAAFALSALVRAGVYNDLVFWSVYPLLVGPTSKERAGAVAVIDELAERGVIDARALPHLVKLLEDSSGLVATWAARAIREYALHGACSPEAPATLTRLLHHAHGEGTATVLRAVRALGEKGFADPLALDPLQKLSKSTAMSGHIDDESGHKKHYTIGELAQAALASVKETVVRDDSTS